MIYLSTPCIKCGDRERYLANGNCVSCLKAYMRRYNARKKVAA